MLDNEHRLAHQPTNDAAPQEVPELGLSMAVMGNLYSVT